MRYLLDTNVVSDIVRHPKGAVAARVADAEDGSICTSIIVAAELRYGIEKKGSFRLAQQLEAVLEGIEILPLEQPVDSIYGRVRATLERTGRLIGPNDLLIAAQALALDLTLVTANEDEFRRVEGLRVENWAK
jgi:tRNA(fMet)-specific endonuclease VapC